MIPLAVYNYIHHCSRQLYIKALTCLVTNEKKAIISEHLGISVGISGWCELSWQLQGGAGNIILSG